MSNPADYRIERTARGEGGSVLALSGDWTAATLGGVGERLARSLKGGPAPPRLDLAALGRIDTSGAYLLAHGAGVMADAGELDARPDARRLIELVQASLPKAAVAPPEVNPALRLLVRAGHGMARVAEELTQTAVFYGRLLVALFRLAAHPSRIRLAPTVSLMERAGLDALPIIAVTNFFIGATVAFLGASLLAQFGAQVFSVELIGIATLREFSVVITAVLLAGRSASSFAAEIGAMKMNQEVDAMQVMGVDPFEALVLPRFIALLTMTPLLTFVGAIAGLFGGMLVVWGALNLSPAFFVQRLLDNVGPRHFYLGMVKTPILAVIIASIGCRQGMEVGGDVEQLGRRVTSAVVQAIFSIIIVDAAFAMLFIQLGQ